MMGEEEEEDGEEGGGREGQAEEDGVKGGEMRRDREGREREERVRQNPEIPWSRRECMASGEFGEVEWGGGRRETSTRRPMIR
eukprot:750443-Hanusia_phi.AAC.5